MTAVALAAAALGAYGAGVARAGRWPWARVLAWAAGCAALGVALGPPLDGPAGERLAPHMAQHLLLAAVAPALLAAAAPVRLALAALPPGGRRALGRALHRPVVRVLAQPPVAVALALAVMVGVHLPGAVDAAVRHPLVHVGEHALLLWSGVLLWAAVLAVDPLPARPSPLARFAWLSLAMIGMTAVGAAYASATRVLVGTYAAHPGALGDQHDAGAIMWVGSGALFAPAILAVVFTALVREEQLQRRREAVRR